MRPTKRTTSRDVAKLAHVSRTTVSFILNNVPGVSISAATRQRVLDAAKKLNYFPNVAGKKLVSGKSYTIGLVLCQSFNMEAAHRCLCKDCKKQNAFHVASCSCQRMNHRSALHAPRRTGMAKCLAAVAVGIATNRFFSFSCATF